MRLQDPVETRTKVAALTTQQAIERAGLQGLHAIAVNFANENHIGGNPPIRYDYRNNHFDLREKPASTQEESLFACSDLSISLGKPIRHPDGSESIPENPNEYGGIDGFSKRLGGCLVSDNHLFGVLEQEQLANFRFPASVKNPQDYRPIGIRPLAQPIEFSTITSASIYFAQGQQLTDENLESVRLRICTQVLAAVEKAVEKNQPTEFVAGAFGCGAFISGLSDAEKTRFREHVAQTYKELLGPDGVADGVFSRVTYAVPSFGNERDINLQSFHEVINGVAPQHEAEGPAPRRNQPRHPEVAPQPGVHLVAAASASLGSELRDAACATDVGRFTAALAQCNDVRVLNEKGQILGLTAQEILHQLQQTVRFFQAIPDAAQLSPNSMRLAKDLRICLSAPFSWNTMEALCTFATVHPSLLAQALDLPGQQITSSPRQLLQAVAQKVQTMQRALSTRHQQLSGHQQARQGHHALGGQGRKPTHGRHT